MECKGGCAAEEGGNWGSDGSAAAEEGMWVQKGNRRRKKNGRAEVGFEDNCFFFCYSMKYPFLDREIGEEEMKFWDSSAQLGRSKSLFSPFR